ncbi:hypothetical protein HYX14_04775 [Candidatus Woesearchaeota archaeon]|nr:hypothetical protein [Candidatus Woesearchaeota archaeon]
MGWLQNAWSKIKPPTQPMLQDLPLSQFSGWLHQQLQDFSESKDVQQQCQEYLAALENWKLAFRSSLPEQSADLRIQQARSLLDKITLPETLLELVNLHERLENSLSLLERSKPPFASQLQGFHQLPFDIAHTQIIKNTRELLRRINLFQDSLCDEQWLQQNLSTKSEQLLQSQEKFEEKEMELLQLYGDQDKESFHARRQLISRLKENRERVFQFFSQVDNLLSQGVSWYPQLKVYRESPLGAFYNDHSLSIITLLEQLHQKVLSGSSSMVIPLTELGKLSPLIEKAPQFLAEAQQEYLQVSQELARLPAKPTGEKNKAQIDDAEYRLEHYQQRIDVLEQEVNALTEQFQERSLFKDREIKLMQELVKLTFGKEIRLGMGNGSVKEESS